MYTLTQLFTAGAIAALVLFAGTVLPRMRVKVIRHTPGGKIDGLAVGAEISKSLEFNPEMVDFDRDAEFEANIKPTVRELCQKLRDTGLSGLVMVSTASSRKEHSHQTQTSVVFLGDEVTPDELMVAKEFGAHGMARGTAALLAYMVKRGGFKNEYDLLASVMALGQNGAEQIKAAKARGED